MELIIALMKSNPELTLPQIAESLNISEKQVKTGRDKLIKEGSIRQEESNKSGDWESNEIA